MWYLSLCYSPRKTEKKPILMSNVRVCASLLVVVVVGVSNATAIQSYPPIHPGIQLSTITTTTPSTKNQIRKKKRKRLKP